MLPSLMSAGRLGGVSCITPAAWQGLSRAFASMTATAPSSAGTGYGLQLPLPDGSDPTVMVSLPERPFASPAQLPGELVARLLSASGTGDAIKRVAVLRPAFLPSDQPQQPVSELVAPLGSAAVALAAATQETPGRVLVDEYVRGSGSRYELAAPARELATYLASRKLKVALVPDVAAAADAVVAHGTGKLPSLPNSVASAARLRSMQCTNSVLMVAPTAFGFNEQAAQDNSFMTSAETLGAGSSLTSRVCAEYAGLHRALADGAGVDVKLFQHALPHGTPDACFPNNWFSTHASGEAGGGVGERTLVLYPMKCPNRAAERRPEIVQFLQRSMGYSRVLDMSSHESTDKAYFEGTGVLVLDRVNGVAYVALSERADKGLAEQWVSSLGYNDLVTFRSFDARDKPVYHTNVMMAVGTDVAVVCADSVVDAKERQNLLAKLGQHHEVVQISKAQMDALCGNALEVQNGRGLPVLAMSTQAYNAFTPDQRAVMRRHVADLVHAPIDTLEKVGGGGVRCAIAELF